MTFPLVVQAFDAERSFGSLRVADIVVAAETLLSAVDVKAIATPPGLGSPAGRHHHDFDQLFYVIDGEMSLEIGDWQGTAGAGSVVVFPAGIEHRNWNAGTETVKHLAFNIPTVEGGQHDRR